MAPETIVATYADEEDEDEEEEAPKTKKVKETVWDWDLLNDNKALWLRSPSDVSEEEYTNFYKALAKVLSLLPSPLILSSSC
jgi:heat shock protein beta